MQPVITLLRLEGCWRSSSRPWPKRSH